MKVAIIGAGNVGKGLGAAAVKAGHEVTMTSRNPEHYAEAAREVGARATPLAEAVQGADLVVLAVPNDAAEAVAREAVAVAPDAVLVDVTNRLNPADPASTLDGSSVAERVQSALPQARVVKAFNTILAGLYANPRVSGQALDAYVAGDDDAAKAAVLELAGSIGFRPLDVGPLAFGRVLEGMAVVNITLQIRNGWSWQSGFKLIGPTGEN